MKPASPASVVAFLGVVLFVITALELGTYMAARRDAGAAAARSATIRFSAALAVWLVAFSLFVASGVIEARPFPLIPITFLIINLAAVVYGLSAAGMRLAANLPLQALVGFQAFRLLLELVLHSWVEQGTIPMAMTWSGANFDILSGITAAALAPFAARPAIAWIANVIGFTLLLNVARVAMMSSPLPFAWDVQPKLLLIAHLPYALIAPVCVAGALFGHIVLTRRLLRESTPSYHPVIDLGKETQALCVACLAHRSDVSEAWLEQETAGKRAMTCYCADDLAFPSIMAGIPNAPCPGCKSAGPVMAVAPQVAASVGRYLQIRKGEEERQES